MASGQAALQLLVMQSFIIIYLKLLKLTLKLMSSSLTSVKLLTMSDHYILKHVFQATGFGEPLLSWLCSFIEGRKQFVGIHGVYFNVLPISSGVPQEGHLSPLQFSIFLNSINHSLDHARLLAFANDVKIFYQINSFDD